LKQKGFTLIELLVIISIIGLLAAVVLVAMNSARIKSRDARRRADLRQMATALALDYDKNGSYTQPENCTSDNSFAGCDGNGTGNWGANSDLQKLVAEGFLARLPIDPRNNATYKYTYEPWNANEGGFVKAGQAYDLCATLESGGSFCMSPR